MKKLFTLIKIQHETVEHIATFTSQTKATKAFQREIFNMHPTWDFLDLDEVMGDLAHFWEGGSLQVIEHEVQK